MPTGFTSTLHDGPQTFPDFALDCARNFGALIEMRDAPHGAEIPDEFKPSTYHQEQLDKARADLNLLANTTEARAQTLADAEHNQAVARNADVRAEKAATQQRYEAMLAEVQAWQPPTSDHVNLKRFMADQLNESIRFDCSTEYYVDPEPQTGAAWLEAAKTKAQRDIEYHAAEQIKDDLRASERTAWVRSLRASLAVNA